MDKKIAIAAVAVIAVVVIAGVLHSLNKEDDKVVIPSTATAARSMGTARSPAAPPSLETRCLYARGTTSSHGTLRETVPEMHTPPGMLWTAP